MVGRIFPFFGGTGLVVIYSRPDLVVAMYSRFLVFFFIGLILDGRPESGGGLECDLPVGEEIQHMVNRSAFDVQGTNPSALVFLDCQNLDGNNLPADFGLVNSADFDL